MACKADISYNINGTDFVVPAADTDENSKYAKLLDVCQATQVLEKLHKQFTEQYNTSGVNVIANKTTPSYYLRNQPTSASDATSINRFHNISTGVSGFTGDEVYRKMVSAILNGLDISSSSTYNTISNDNLWNGDSKFDSSFNGIFGIKKAISMLEYRTNGIISSLNKSNPSSSSQDAISRFNQRKEIKNTLEEVSYRENEIYREKVLYILLIIVGIILVGTQLAQNYFSGVGGVGSSGGSGGAGLGGLLGFGVGSSGGLFSRFGGLGLGSSGRSHFDIGNLFKNSSYTLQQR
jgi:hypothetical protein